MTFIFQWTVPSPDEPLLWLWFLLPITGLFVTAAALVALALLFPVPLARPERPRAAVAGALVAGYIAVAVPWVLRELPEFFDAAGYIPENRPWVAAFTLGVVVFGGASWGFVALLALRFRGATPRVRAQMALAAIGVVLWPAYASGLMSVASPPFGFLRATGAPALFALAAVAAFWLAVARGDAGRMARNVALIALAAALAGMISTAGSPNAVEATRLGGFGFARITAVVVLAYAIVRHQLLGIDVKVRWTISRTTVAAVFVAVFFVTSEAAQQFFGETLGSSYVGILAAGALVFAIAPLTRLADRVAARAVPGAGRAQGPDGAEDHVAREAAFMAAVRAALRDGRLTRREERHLADVAEHLRIGPRRALALREQAETEDAPRGAV